MSSPPVAATKVAGSRHFEKEMMVSEVMIPWVDMASTAKQTVAIIGAGWGAYPLSQQLNLTRYNVKVISPVRTLQYTPLLASAACGLFDLRLAEEPLRRQHRTQMEYYKAAAEDIDLQNKIIRCKPAVQELNGQVAEMFEVPYDKIVLAPGCEVQTFGTPGAMEHALFLRNTNDARLLQQRMLQMLDAASLPGLSEERQREILHIRIVGGGAIGIEATAELYDLWHESMRHLHPHLDGKVTITVHDVAPSLLSTFDQSLSAYAMRSLEAKKVEMKTSSHIERVEADAIFTKEDGRLPYGLLLWATGNKASSLLDRLEVRKPEKGLPRILTDKYLRALRPDGTPIEDTYALGDAADIEGQSLPTLAEVALQKGEYLTRELNKAEGHPTTPFEFDNKGMMAYLGNRDGVVAGKADYTGESAWLAWRSGSLQWCRTWRRRVMISISWLFVWLNGRDIARR
ncbi:FAD/NAD(P)-binding domain-containing protein [Hortaea werneckii]|nr:FAD/NAD(P)-binding domain-containing protein [Hortaea werneckii]KAI7603281.1 FAD/NAD(P)-binding domain-containing protein [Hortaea werneckii]KAI7610122.1 FAD/NAD(P)-binding domain-containing protein [Hortaea werneckii]KAI7643833.1 FAD/NAD(P)-binding domain-containing protein [Hortaea werneckii]KAI7687391.1 FAD/NAD(P)-binding domain-containing protein [Hortaea werneckii]